MLGVEFDKWNQSVEDLRYASVHATHPRTRERFQALSLIASGQFNATACAAPIGRQDDTVLFWLHRSNPFGPDALTYRRSGGRAPLFLPHRPNRLFRPSKTVSRPTTACPATSGR